MKISFVAFLLSLHFASSAQVDNPETLPTKIYELKVKTRGPASLHLPFQSIKIIDSRYDTSKIGFLYTHSFFSQSKKPFRLTRLNNGVQQSVESFYNEYYKMNFSNNGNRLLIVLKKLWIADVSSSAVEQTNEYKSKTARQFVYAKFEYYAGVNNTYIPLKRIDTLFQLLTTPVGEEYNPKEEGSLPFLCFSLENMVEKMNYDEYFDHLTNKRSMTQEELIEVRTKEKHMLILQEPTKQGVFVTFDEFKNNTPSITAFNKNIFPKQKVYELLDAKKNVILHYYACFDGDKLLMPIPYSLMLPGNTNQTNPVAYRVGNSFEFYQMIGNMDAELKFSQSTRRLRLPHKNLEYLPRQIDMETGLAY